MKNILFADSPYSINYQLARCLIAVAQLLNLLFTPYNFYFHSFFKPNIIKTPIPNLFLDYGDGFGYWASVIILIWVISGYVPQLSSILHAWLSHSFFFGSLIIEGGDQLAQIMTILLVPICLGDARLNIWLPEKTVSHGQFRAGMRLFARSAFKIAQIQMSLVYLFAASVKISVPEWVNGSALHYWFHNEPFGAASWLHFLGDYFMNSHLFSPLINWSVLALEFILFAALFMSQENRQRLFVPALIFHALIGMTMGLWSFGLIMCAGLVLYLRPNMVRVAVRSPKIKNLQYENV